MDKLTFTFEPGALVAINPAEDLKIYGVVFYFVPRSLSVGWLAATSRDQSDPNFHPIVHVTALQPDMPMNTESVVPFTQMYSIFWAVVGTTVEHPAPSILAYNIWKNKWNLGYNSAAFNKYVALEASITGARIAGAGMKVLPMDAPINTGGIAYGGWMPLEDLYASIKPQTESPEEKLIDKLTQRLARDEKIIHDARLSTAQSFENGRLGYCASIEQKNNNSTKLNCVEDLRIARDRVFQYGGRRYRLHPRPRLKLGATSWTANEIMDALKFRARFKGIDGVTVRYSPLQDTLQAMYQPVNEEALYADQALDSDDPAYNTNVGVGVGTHDLISSAGLVPGIVWMYDVADDGPTNYALAFEARVHIQATPEGRCPFQQVLYPPITDFVKIPQILSSMEAYPAAVKGSSFESFHKGLNEALGTVASVMKLVG
jgi:hypothetical protein